MICYGLQVKLSSHDPDAEAEVKEPGAEVTIPHEEYQALTRKAREVEELANKRVAMAMAQVMSRLLKEYPSYSVFNNRKHAIGHINCIHALYCRPPYDIGSEPRRVVNASSLVWKSSTCSRWPCYVPHSRVFGTEY